MKIRKKPGRLVSAYIFITLVVSALAAGAAFLILQRSQSNTNLISVAPLSQTVAKGSDASFTIRFNPANPVDVVTATLSYDPSSLEYKETKYDNSSFDSHIPAIVLENNITIQVAKMGGDPVSRESNVATVVFISKDGGKAIVKIADGNTARAGLSTKPKINSDTPVLATILGAVSLALLVSTLVTIILARHKAQRSK